MPTALRDRWRLFQHLWLEGGESLRFARPTRTAALLALAYVACAGLYIWVSGRVAAVVAGSVENLQRIELMKGLLFVLVSGGLFFVFSWLVMKRLQTVIDRVVEGRRALLAAERRALAGVFAASFAHDINNVLQVAKGQMLDLADHRDLNREGQQALTALEDLHERLGEIARRLMTVAAHSGPDRVEEFDLAERVRQMGELLERHGAVRTRRFSVSVPDAPVVIAGRSALVEQMILNLVINAAEAGRPQGRIEVRLTAEEDRARLEVHDDGPGVAPDRRHEIFRPFVSTKPHGTGLGLLSVKAGAEGCGGRIEIVTSDLGGACFRVTCPARLERLTASGG